MLKVGGTREISAAVSRSEPSTSPLFVRIPGAGAPTAPSAAPVCVWETSDARKACLPRPFSKVDCNVSTKNQEFHVYSFRFSFVVAGVEYSWY